MKKSLLIFLIPLLAMQACVLHPPYRRPTLDIPLSWRIEGNEASSYANCSWWKQFNDPVLDDLIVEALNNNNDLKVAISRVYEFAARLMIARSQLYPQIDGVFKALRQETSIAIDTLPPGFPRTTNQYFAFLQASYELDIWGKIRSASEAALARLLASIEARRTVVLTLVSAVASSYIQLLQYDLQLQISLKTLESRKESFQLAQLRFLGGLTSELEAKQSEAEMDEAATQVIEFQLLIAREENLLSILMGKPPEAIKRGIELTKLNLPPDIPIGIPSDVLIQRPDIMEAEENLISANAEIGVAKAQFFPDISLTGLYGNSSIELNKLFSGPSRMWEYGITLTQPLFTGWRLTGELRIAEAKKCEAYFQYRQAVLNAFKEVNDALVFHQQSKKQVDAQSKRVDALTVALQLATKQYENGQVDYLNVLDAQRNLFTAQLDLALAQSETFLSLISIYKTLGGGWVVEADNITGSCEMN